jgi:NADH-quinone oxidoreductase subunit J
MKIFMFELTFSEIFSGLMCISSIMVISARNPVHSVLFLILTFINAAGLLFLLEIEFLSFIFIVVYVGAIAVLFLFVVMMLDIKIAESNQNFSKFFYVSVLVLFGTTFINEPFTTENDYLHSLNIYVNWFKKLDLITNIEALGQILYTYYFAYIIIVGILLLIAMLGAVVLTLVINKNSRSQATHNQISRSSKNAVFLINYS